MAKKARSSRSIEEYRRKRDFGKTPEPAPEQPPADDEPRTFVVHRHEARRLHYDLRLRIDGVLKSFAVPKGFSYDRNDKHLAVRTEDHPLEYETFHGVIPKGQYGAGTMTIWDHGTYAVPMKESAADAVEGGKLEIVLCGRRLRGEWHLVRTSEEKHEWLLFKARDRYALDKEVGAGTLDYTDLDVAPFPAADAFMQPAEEVAPFSDPEWWFEVRFEGLRVQVRKQGDEVALLDGGGRDLGPELPEVAQAWRDLRAVNAVAEAVVVALDANERPSGKELARRRKTGETTGLQCYAFDLLYCEEFDLTPCPLRRRKQALAAVLPRSRSLLYMDHVEGEGEKLAEVVRGSGLPGVIAKRADAPYVAGPSSDWRTLKTGKARRKKAPLREALQSAAPGRKVEITNPDKVFFPEHGLTKGDFVRYHEQVADVLVPYLRDRPLHLNRFPDGIHGKSFYQKNAPEHLPDWIHTEDIPSDGGQKTIRYIVCDDAATLLYLANLGSIDLHPWMSRLGSLDSPDWAVLDLDPKGAPFSDVVKIARAIGKLLRGIGIRPSLKTSGKTGLHIHVPLIEGYTYDHGRMFCEGVARYVAREHADIATVERVVDARGGKVYIDFLQNHQGQTVVPPYVVRPVPGAQVSAPLDWDELDSDLSPANFTIQNMPDRLRRVGDRFAGTLTDRQDLLPAIEKLQAIMGT